MEWYLLSAEQGNANAQAKLGTMYENGRGVLQNNVLAHMWYNISSANGLERAMEYRDMRTRMMTPKEVSKAQTMARECVESDYKKCGY